MTRLPGAVIASSVLLLIMSIVGILVLGRDIFGPLAGALIIWFIINALARGISRVRRATVVQRVDMFLALLVFCAASIMIGLLTISNAEGLRNSASVYNENLSRALSDAWRALGFSTEPDFQDLVSAIDLNDFLLSAIGSAADAIASLIMVVLYLAFLFAEQAVFPKKLGALIEEDRDREVLQEKLSRLRISLEKYIGIKFLEGILLAAGTLIALKLYGVDFAWLWALAVLLISFVPTIGTIVGTTVPALVALMQFGEWRPVVELTIMLGTLQVLVNNVLEPRLLGRSFNLSPVIILVVLAAGFEIWGVLGAILAIPLLVIAITICADFRATRPIAVILSGGEELEQNRLS
jgi:predicted PurR-regulated permease PerM